MIDKSKLRRYGMFLIVLGWVEVFMYSRSTLLTAGLIISTIALSIKKENKE